MNEVVERVRSKAGWMSRSRRLWAPVACVAVVAVLASACGSSLPYVWVQSLPPAELAQARDAIGTGDLLSVFVQDQQSLTGEFRVRADGTFVQPLVGAVPAADKTPEEVANALRGTLKGMIVDPKVTVSIAERAPIRVGVVGEVTTPGQYQVAADVGVLGVLAHAGGLNDFADEDEIFVVRREPRLSRIRFRFRDLTRPESAATQFRLRDGDTVVVD